MHLKGLENKNLKNQENKKSYLALVVFFSYETKHCREKSHIQF